MRPHWAKDADARDAFDRHRVHWLIAAKPLMLGLRNWDKAVHIRQGHCIIPVAVRESCNCSVRMLEQVAVVKLGTVATGERADISTAGLARTSGLSVLLGTAPSCREMHKGCKQVLRSAQQTNAQGGHRTEVWVCLVTWKGCENGLCC